MALETVVLRDETTGSTAKILPGFGFNCYGFTPVVNGEPIEALWAVPDFDSGQQRPSRSGTPLLFPFAGRIRGTQYTYQGRTYELEPADPQGNAIHGFVMNRPWKVVEQSGQRVVGQFRLSEASPSIIHRWPADFIISIAYELRGNHLSTEINIVNPDDKPLPFGFGMHSYFRVPIGRGKAEDCLITVPVSERWPLEGLLPTGAREPATGKYDLASGVRFGDATFDDVFSGLANKTGNNVSEIHDPTSGRTLRTTFGPGFEAVVVFVAPHREAMCIEPYTALPDFFNLEARGIDSGMIVLPPGESKRYQVSFEVT